MQDLLDNLQKLKAFFTTGATQTYAFRREALEKLRNAVSQH